MNLTLEKEKIKKEIDLIDDIHLIKAIKKLLAEYDVEDMPEGMVNEPTITDEEMAIPGGRKPSKAQLKKWLENEDDEFMTGKEALAHSLKVFEETKAKGKKK